MASNKRKEAYHRSISSYCGGVVLLMPPIRLMGVASRLAASACAGNYIYEFNVKPRPDATGRRRRRGRRQDSEVVDCSVSLPDACSLISTCLFVAGNFFISFVFMYIHLIISNCLSLFSICIYLSHSIYWSSFLFVYQSTYLIIYWSIYVYTLPYIIMNLSSSICLSIHLCVYLPPYWSPHARAKSLYG